MKHIHKPQIARPTWLALLFLGAFPLACGVEDEWEGDEFEETRANTLAGGSIVNMVPVHAGTCIGVQDASASNGALIRSQTCNGSDFQRWRAELDPEGYYELVNIGSGKCLDVPGASSTWGIDMIQWTCWGGDNQRWSVSDLGDGSFSIINKASGLALDVAGYSTANGARVVQWNWKGSANQKFQLDGEQTCNTAAPLAEMQETIDLTWSEMTGGFEGKPGARPVSAGIQNFKNSILDQVQNTGGTLNYCVRWDSQMSVSPQLRAQIEAALSSQINQWFDQLSGYDCWPYDKISVKVTGWATYNRSLLQWNDDSTPIYVGDIYENAPECAQACGRFFHQQAGYSYPDCPGGAANHYDMSLWLTDGFGGGVGGDWGQRVGTTYFIDNVGSDSIHIFLHEFGHGLGFPDYYNWDQWVPGVPVPPTIMNAGASMVITDWDMWMARHTWSQLKQLRGW